VLGRCDRERIQAATKAHGEKFRRREQALHGNVIRGQLRILTRGPIAIAVALWLCAPVFNSCISAVDPAQTGDISLEGQLAEGVKLISAGRFREAEEVLNNVKQLDPEDARPYFYCGMALAQAGRLPDAASELVEAVHLAPDRLEYRVFQAHVSEQLVQTYAAENTLAIFQTGLALRRLAPSWLRLLADVYYRLGKADDALRVLDLWEESAPHSADIDLDRGRAYVLKSRPDVACKFFQASIAESGRNPEAFFELGKILYARGDFHAAREALSKAVQQDDRNPEYRSKLASAYLALSEPDAAIACLKTVEASGDQLPAIYYDLGRAYRSKGEAERGDEYAKRFQQLKAAERERSDRRLAADRPIGQAQRQLDQGHPQEARALFEKAMQIDPNRWEPNAYLAEMDLNSGEFQAAYPHLQKLEHISPDSPVASFLQARYWFQEKDYARARVYAEKVLVSRPDNSELRIMLGDIYLQLGEKPKAFKEYEEAARLAPGRGDLRERLQNAGETGSDGDRKSQP
jgi:Flp pilus assembly protein TadD